jgi:hypothetical protein
MAIASANGIRALPKKDVFGTGKVDTDYFTQVKEGGAEGPGTWQRADSRRHACPRLRPPSAAVPGSAARSFTRAHLPAAPPLVSIP